MPPNPTRNIAKATGTRSTRSASSTPIPSTPIAVPLISGWPRRPRDASRPARTSRPASASSAARSAIPSAVSSANATSAHWNHAFGSRIRLVDRFSICEIFADSHTAQAIAAKIAAPASAARMSTARFSAGGKLRSKMSTAICPPSRSHSAIAPNTTITIVIVVMSCAPRIGAPKPRATTSASVSATTSRRPAAPRAADRPISPSASFRSAVTFRSWWRRSPRRPPPRSPRRERPRHGRQRPAPPPATARSPCCRPPP